MSPAKKRGPRRWTLRFRCLPRHGSPGTEVRGRRKGRFHLPHRLPLVGAGEVICGVGGDRNLPLPPPPASLFLSRKDGGGGARRHGARAGPALTNCAPCALGHSVPVFKNGTNTHGGLRCCSRPSCSPEGRPSEGPADKSVSTWASGDGTPVRLVTRGLLPSGSASLPPPRRDGHICGTG